MIIEVISQKNTDLLEQRMSDKLVCIVLYYSDTCYHCNMMKSEWTKFETKYKNNNNCIIAKVEAQNMNLLNNKPIIMGYPSIYKYGNGTKKEYNGDRSCDDLVQFAGVKKSTTKTKTKRKSSKKGKSSKGKASKGKSSKGKSTKKPSKGKARKSK